MTALCEYAVDKNVLIFTLEKYSENIIAVKEWREKLEKMHVFETIDLI